MKRLMTYGIFLTGIFLSIVAFWYSTKKVQEREYLRFEIVAKQMTTKVKGRMESYRETLYAGVGLFEASESVESDEWYRFVKALKIDTIFPGIQGIGFTKVLSPNQIKNSKKYQELYTSILYLEPINERNAHAIGYDMFSEEVRKDAMLRALYSTEAATSGKVRLVQERGADEQSGFLMYAPVYYKGMPLTTKSERLAAIEGFVYAPFRGDDLMRGILEDRYKNIGLQIYDGEKKLKNLIYDGYQKNFKMSKIVIETKLNIDGKVWTLCFTPYQGFKDESDTATPWFILALGITLSFIVLSVMVSILRTKEKAQFLAEKMTQKLMRQKQFLDNVFENNAAGIFVVDQNRNIIMVNQRLCDIFGYTKEELLGKSASFLHVNEEGYRTFARYFTQAKNGERAKIEYTFKDKNGKQLLCEFLGMHIEIDKNNTGVTWSVLDISKRKRAEIELQNSEEKFRNVYETRCSYASCRSG